MRDACLHRQLFLFQTVCDEAGVADLEQLVPRLQRLRLAADALPKLEQVRHGEIAQCTKPVRHSTTSSNLQVLKPTSVACFTLFSCAGNCIRWALYWQSEVGSTDFNS